MASLKFALFVLSAVLLASQAQSYVAHPVKADINILDIIKKVANAVEKVIDEVLTKADKVIDAADTDYNGILKKVVNIVDEATTTALDELNKALNDVAANGDANGKKLAKCIVAEEKDSVAVVTTLVSSMGTCLQDPLSNVVSDLTPLSKDLIRLNQKCKEQVTKLNECEGNDINGIACAVNALGEIVTLIGNEVDNIISDLQPVKADLPDLKNSIVKCWNQEKEKALVNAGKVLNNVAACNNY